MTNDIIQFTDAIKNFSLEELKLHKEELLKNLATMIADPLVGIKLAAIEQEIDNRKQVVE